jgi:hypothetical protein
MENIFLCSESAEPTISFYTTYLDLFYTTYASFFPVYKTIHSYDFLCYIM